MTHDLPISDFMQSYPSTIRIIITVVVLSGQQIAPRLGPSLRHHDCGPDADSGSGARVHHVSVQCAATVRVLVVSGSVHGEVHGFDSRAFYFNLHNNHNHNHIDK